jgi:hypothetical protein
MRRNRLQRLTVALLLSTYSVASIAGGLLHHHAGDSHHDHDLACHHGHAVCHHSDAGDAHDRLQPCDGGRHTEPPANADHEYEASHGGLIAAAPEGTLVDDDCCACRFVSQRTLGVELVSATNHFTHSVELSLRLASQQGVSVARTLHSRAPPCLG